MGQVRSVAQGDKFFIFKLEHLALNGGYLVPIQDFYINKVTFTPFSSL
jgi:hypothetical protein